MENKAMLALFLPFHSSFIVCLDIDCEDIGCGGYQAYKKTL